MTIADTSVTPLEVCQSNAGFYVGTKYYDKECGSYFPNSRESQEYYPTFEEAQAALTNNTFTQRLHP